MLAFVGPTQAIPSTPAAVPVGQLAVQLKASVALRVTVHWKCCTYRNMLPLFALLDISQFARADRSVRLLQERNIDQVSVLLDISHSARPDKSVRLLQP